MRGAAAAAAALLVGMAIIAMTNHQDVVSDFVFDLVPSVPTETMCYYSTAFISFSTCTTF